MKSWSDWFGRRVHQRREKVRHALRYNSREELRRMAERGELGPLHHHAGL